MTAPGSYRIVTLGCKLNQFDSASIEGQLRVRGLVRAREEDEAALVVVNTCTVTENADREARRLIRRERRASPRSRLFVTGCYAESGRGRLATMREVDAVVGHSDRERLTGLLDDALGQSAPAAVARPAAEGSGERAGAPAEIACIDAAGEEAAPWFGERTRAFLKVQEGCDLACAYCIIPSVRGRSRSTGPERLAAALRGLVGRGFVEIVLTGVNTGDWGKDLAPPSTLPALLRGLLTTPGLGRLRLNSLEPRTVTDEIVDLFGASPRLCRHLQVPLQSGSDRVLRMMRRNYRTADYGRTLERLRRAVPGIGLGADVIVGFPGESESDFEATLEFIASSPLNYLHVFSYSDRPGAPASRLDGHVPAGAIRERSARLRELGASLGLAFRRSFQGRTLPGLILAGTSPDGLSRALTDNYIEVLVAGSPALVNTLLAVRIDRVDGERVLGSIEPAGAGDLPAGAPAPPP